MSGKDIATIVAAVASIGVAALEHIERRHAEQNTVEVARVLAPAGQATAEAKPCQE